MTEYDVRCPKCAKHAIAEMRDGGLGGTYRSPLTKFVARRIICNSCGFNVTSDDPIPYELWFKVAVRGQTAWAYNRSHAMFLIDYLCGRIPSYEIERADVEALPGRMLEAKNREVVVRKLQGMLDAD